MANDESTLTVKRVIDTDPEILWKALTDQNIMKKWFFAAEEGWSAVVANNLEVGGSYQIDMQSPENTYRHEGVYKEIVPGSKLVFTWNSQAVTDTLVTITLEKVENGTEVTLVHEFMPNEEMKENHTRGWTQILENLENTLTG